MSLLLCVFVRGFVCLVVFDPLMFFVFVLFRVVALCVRAFALCMFVGVFVLCVCAPCFVFNVQCMRFVAFVCGWLVCLLYV